MDKPSKSAEQLEILIKKAIADGILTPDERESIMVLADQNGIIDPQERRLLNELQNMIDNGTVKVQADN